MKRILIFIAILLIYVDITVKLEFDYDNSKYLLYLPHSGMNNQRISLENAMILSKLLNRTLIIPPLFIGKSMPKQKFTKLYKILTFAMKEIKNTRPESKTYEIVTFDEIFDVKGMADAIQLMYKESDEFLETKMKDIFYILNDNYCKYIISDQTVLNSDFMNDQNCTNTILSLQSLIKVPQKYIFFDSLFGSEKLMFMDKNYQELQQTVVNNFQLNNRNSLYRSSRAIANKLKQFIGIHYRANSKQFKGSASWFLFQITQELKKYNANYRKYKNSNINGFVYSKYVNTSQILNSLYSNTSISWPTTTNKDIPSNIDSINQLNRTDLIDFCTAHSESLMMNNITDKYYMIIYMATDVPNPLQNKELIKFRQTFPCTFFLGDFFIETNNALYNNHKKDKLLYFIDQYVTGMSTAFYGLGTSTFSQFSFKLYQLNHNCTHKQLFYEQPLLFKDVLTINGYNSSTHAQMTHSFTLLPLAIQLGIKWAALGCGIAKKF